MTDVKKKAYSKQRQLITDYKHVFGTEQGRRVLHDMMKAHFMISPTHVKNDALGTSYNEGMRNVVLRILSFIKMDVARFDELLKQGETDDYGAND